MIAWQRAFTLGLSAYRLSLKRPEHGRFGLCSPLRRGAMSIASNMAEGSGRGVTADHIRLLKVARDALYKLETQLLLTIELLYVDSESSSPVKGSLEDAERVLAGWIRSPEHLDSQ